MERSIRYLGFQGTNSRQPTDLWFWGCVLQFLQGALLGGDCSTGRDIGPVECCSASSSGSLAALVHEGGGSRSGEQGSESCGYYGDSPLGDDFSESTQLYSRR